MPNTAPLKIKTLRFKYEKINSKNQHTLHKISYSNLTCTPNRTIPRSSQRFQELTKIDQKSCTLKSQPNLKMTSK